MVRLMPKAASNFYIWLCEAVGKRVPERLQPLYNHEAGRFPNPVLNSNLKQNSYFYFFLC